MARGNHRSCRLLLLFSALCLTISDVYGSTVAPCISGNQWSSAIANTNVVGGTANAATSIDACKAACQTNTNCAGIDWATNNAAGSQCFIILTTATGPRNNGTATGVTHYDYGYVNCNSGGCSYVWSAAISNTNVQGGTVNAATTVDLCKAACVLNTNCIGIDWNPSNSAGLQCFIIISTSAGTRNNGTAYGVTHYDYTLQCNTVCVGDYKWSAAYANTNVQGGTVNAATTLDACKTACALTANCVGVDWNPTNSAGQQCFIITSASAGQRNSGTASGVTHYDYSYASCSPSCASTWSSAFANTNVQGGQVNSATSVDACKAACASTTNCTGIDWATTNSVGLQCFIILTTAAGTRNNGTATGVTHYDYSVSCLSCSPGWTMYANTNVQGGSSNAATSVAACQSACTSTQNCIGIDWASGNSAGQQCFLIISTSAGTRNNGTAYGVTHYDYSVNCNQGCGYAWSGAIANTNVVGGTANSATTLDACKAACLAYSNCAGIDWTASNAVSQQCFIILTTTAGQRNNGTSTGVTHFDFSYSCPTSTSVWQSTIQPTSYASSSGCVSSYVWSSAIANTNVLGGNQNGATSVAACQTACASTTNCIGIDWVAGNSAGQQCFIIVSTSAGQRNNGTAYGVTHYDYYYAPCTTCSSWSSAIANTNVLGGIANGATSVATCQSACVSTANCIGIDWNSANSAGQQCFIITSTSAGQRNSGTATGVTHYDYSSTKCSQPCGYAWSAAISNTNVAGGTVNGAASVDACKTACWASTNCIGIDWNPSNGAGYQCYLILTTTTGQRNNGSAPGVTHYDYIYSCTSGALNTAYSSVYASSSSCVSGYVWSPSYANTNVLGGTANAAATVDACKTACTSTTSCIGIDWNPSNSAGQQCFVIKSTSAGQRNNGTATGVTHYDYYYSTCIQGCGYAWSAAIANTNVVGGTANGATSVDACKAACLAYTTCAGIDWNPSSSAGYQCYFILTTTTGPRNSGTATGITHYDYGYSCSTGNGASAYVTDVTGTGIVPA